MPRLDDPLTILTYVLAVAIGFLLYFALTKIKVSKANVDATKIVEEATAKADNIVKEAILDAKTQAYEYKLDAEKDIKEQRLEVTKFENKLLQREQNIDRRDIALQGKEDVLDDKARQLEKKSEELGKLEAQLKEQIDAKIVELEKIAAMSANEAKEELFKLVEQKMSKEVTAFIKEQEDEAKSKASLYAKDIKGRSK